MYDQSPTSQSRLCRAFMLFIFFCFCNFFGKKISPVKTVSWLTITTFESSIPWDAQFEGSPLIFNKNFFFKNSPLNWVFKLDQFRSNWITFRNGVWVRAEERARKDTNGPILWGIVCRGCEWSFFKF